MNPTNNVPLFQSMTKLGTKLEAYRQKPDSNTKDTIVQLLDRCFDDYEKALVFMKSPMDNNVSQEFGDSYLTSRTLDNWHENLPSIINIVAALQLGQQCETLKRMQNDGRYEPTFSFSK